MDEKREVRFLESSVWAKMDPEIELSEMPEAIQLGTN